MVMPWALDLITTPEPARHHTSWMRGYVDFQRLYVIHQAGAFFVTRTKVTEVPPRLFHSCCRIQQLALL